MKSMIAAAALILAVNPLRAQTPESLKTLGLDMLNMRSVKAVALSRAAVSPVPAESAARAGDIRTKSLYAADGTVIRLKYSIANQGVSMVADPVKFEVSNKAFGSGNKIRVVFINYYDQGGPSGKIDETQQIDLTYAGGTSYTGCLPHGVGLAINYNNVQEIAVVVDGKWLVTTDGKSNNFPIKMSVF